MKHKIRNFIRKQFIFDSYYRDTRSTWHFIFAVDSLAISSDIRRRHVLWLLPALSPASFLIPSASDGARDPFSVCNVHNCISYGWPAGWICRRLFVRPAQLDEWTTIAISRHSQTVSQHFLTLIVVVVHRALWVNDVRSMFVARVNRRLVGDHQWPPFDQIVCLNPKCLRTKNDLKEK